MRRQAIHQLVSWELCIPVDFIYSEPPHDAQVDNVIEYAAKQAKYLYHAHKFARTHLQQAGERAKTRDDHDTNSSQFEQEDAIWLHNPRCMCQRPKLTTPWEDMYLVEERLSDMT